MRRPGPGAAYMPNDSSTPLPELSVGCATSDRMALLAIARRHHNHAPGRGDRGVSGGIRHPALLSTGVNQSASHLTPADKRGIDLKRRATASMSGQQLDQRASILGPHSRRLADNHESHEVARESNVRIRNEGR